MRLHERDERDLSAVDVAVLVDGAYLDHWPLEWTRAGKRSVRCHTEGRHYNGLAVVGEARVATNAAGFRRIAWSNPGGGTRSIESAT
jgi:hypothetical protein